MRRLADGERQATLLLGAGGMAGLLILHRPWAGDGRIAWVWAGVAAAALLAGAGAVGRRGLAAAAAFLVMLAPWDFAYPLALPYLVLAVVLLLRAPVRRDVDPGLRRLG